MHYSENAVAALGLLHLPTHIAWWKVTAAYTTGFMTNVTCGLKPGSVPCPTLVIECGTILSFYHPHRPLFSVPCVTTRPSRTSVPIITDGDVQWVLSADLTCPMYFMV